MVNQTQTLERAPIDVLSEIVNPPTVSKNEIILPGNQCRNFRMPGDVIRRAIAELEEDTKQLIWWLFQYCHSRDLNKVEMGRLLKNATGGYYSANSIVQLLNGDRIRKGENITNIVDAIRPLRELETTREAMINSGFIRTRLYTETEARLDGARARQRIFFGFGDSQIGKTTIFEAYQRSHNHGQTIYVDMPTGGSLGKFVKALAKAFNITAKNMKIDALQDRIMESIDGSMLILIDNAQRCLRSRTAQAGLSTLSWIQEIFDHCRCGMGVSMTNEGRDELLRGPHAKALQQLWRRRYKPLQFPNVTPADDLALFAEAYGLPEADDEVMEVTVIAYDDNGKKRTVTHHQSPLKLQLEVNMKEGLGVWISILQDASDMAVAQKREIDWGAVIKAHAQSLADAEIFE